MLSNSWTGETIPRISAVIPTLSGFNARLLDALKDQTWPPDKIEVVQGVRPNGRARNLGILQTSGEFLILIDDDAIPAQRNLIEKLVLPLLADPKLGATGASRLIPPNSGRFQRWTAHQVSRIENPVVHAPVETRPDSQSYFYAHITTTCCAIRRSVFDEIGGFDEELTQGVDTDFFIRASGAGYTLRLEPDLWVYHPAPPNLKALLLKHFRYGFGHAQQVTRNPERARGPESRPFMYLLLRSIAILPHIFLPFSYAEPDLRLGFKPLKALASYASALGYTWGRIKMKRLPGTSVKRDSHQDRHS
jgi:cellulose synthase/poly-beta-1,6-N-acetylglucosamine synthase-like glycosyltransferase